MTIRPPKLCMVQYIGTHKRTDRCLVQPDRPYHTGNKTEYLAYDTRYTAGTRYQRPSSRRWTALAVVTAELCPPPE